MKKFLSFCFFLSYLHAAYCQGLHIDSTRFITGNECCTQIRYAIPTNDKGILFVGSVSGNPGGIIPYFPIDTGVNGNVLIGKIDSNQKISWVKVYGGSDIDDAVSACQTPDGGYAVLAQTFSSNGDVTGFKGGSDIWLLRIDASGNLLWEKTYGSSRGDNPTSIANTTDHGFILLGSTNGNNNDVPFHYGDVFSDDWLVIKTDSTGSIQWSKDIGGTGDEQYYGSILAIDNNYYIVSSTNSNDRDCTDSAWYGGVPTGDNYYVLRLDDTGKVLWDSSYGGSGDDIVYNAFFDTRDSTIVMIGGTLSGDYMVTGYHGAGDMWVIKVNKNGTLIWQKALGSSRPESGSGICAASNGGYMAFGGTSGVIGGGDGWLVSIDNSGNEIANKIFGGTSNDLTFSIVPYLNGYAATGISSSTVFTEGSTYGNFANGGGFVSYIDSGTLGASNLYNNAEHVIAVYPNPANSNVNIVMPKNEVGSLIIFNSMGQKVYNEQIQKQSHYINIPVIEWSNGLYFIEWNSADGNVKTAKFVKM